VTGPGGQAGAGDLLGLSGKRVVVLGAGQGIGYATVRHLALAGADVVCVDREKDLAAAVAAEVGGRAVCADVTDGADLERALGEAADAGSVHGIVDIVGVASNGPLARATDAELDAEITIVTRHVMHVLRLAGQVIGPDGGAVAVVGSLSGVAAIPGQGVYGAAKAATHQLVRVGAIELAPRGITVNAVAPFFVRTPRLNARLSEEKWETIARSTPDRRVADPADVAGVLLFLMSGLARHLTGQILPLDGGLSATVALPPLPELGW
jgi:NAD(P)-dependent dehydrogenase (short-subunit alcohol dehydrogenase family)